MENKDQMYEKVDRLLARARQGDTAAMNEVWEVMQPELRSIARSLLRGERSVSKFGDTGSGLVNELWIRLVPTMHTITSARSLLACSRKAMQNTLIDYSRYTHQQGRDCRRKTALEDALIVVGLTDDHTLEHVWEAVDKLREQHPAHADLVDHYYVYGLTQEELAKGKGISRQKVDRKLAFAVAWIKNYLGAHGAAA